MIKFEIVYTRDVIDKWILWDLGLKTGTPQEVRKNKKVAKERFDIMIEIFNNHILKNIGWRQTDICIDRVTKALNCEPRQTKALLKYFSWIMKW